MKKFIIALCTVFSIIVICTSGKPLTSNGSLQVEVVTYGKCEYIMVSRYSSGTWSVALTHKGDCQYCTKKHNVEFEKLLRK